MKELTNPRWIKLKGVLFLLLGITAATLILAAHPRIQTALLLCVTVWCFCRFYYFAFYVIEHYVDPQYRFSGLGDFIFHLLFHRPEPRTRDDRSRSSSKIR